MGVYSSMAQSSAVPAQVSASPDQRGLRDRETSDSIFLVLARSLRPRGLRRRVGLPGRHQQRGERQEPYLQRQPPKVGKVRHGQEPERERPNTTRLV
jgi:hypothetical protein